MHDSNGSQPLIRSSLIARWQLLLIAMLGWLLLAAIERGISPVVLGALCVAWSAWSAWWFRLNWTVFFWLIGLIICAGRNWPVSWAQVITAAPVVVIALVSAGWMHYLNQRLEHESRLARLDGLTGLPNRQAFVDRCAAELNRALRFQRPLTLILLDGDRFKAVNDQRGHAAGDQALQATARILREGTRQYDLVARLGGDEFVILLPETAAQDAEKVTQRLQAALATVTFAPLTYSIGAATFCPGRWNVAECLAHTDRLLYSAKQSGRGQIRAETLTEQAQ